MVQAKAEDVCTAKIANDLLFAAAKHKTCDFILTVVEDTWVHKLREPVTFYSALAPSKSLSYLKILCIGLYAVDVLALQK